MFFEPVIETDDKSFYADRLEGLTGLPRSFWGLIPLGPLRELCEKAARGAEKGGSRENTHRAEGG